MESQLDAIRCHKGAKKVPKKSQNHLTLRQKGLTMILVRKTEGKMENDEQIATRLLALASTPVARSKIGRLRTWLPAIEISLKAGLSLEVILEELNSQGLEMKFSAFKTALYRIRKNSQAKPVPSAMPLAGMTPNKGPAAETETETKTLQESNTEDQQIKILSPKERREKLADQFISHESTNPLLKRLNKGNK